MSSPFDLWTVRRILVALDASHHSLAALEAAADLAASMGAELEGLFVEDVRLLRVAEAAAAREVRYPFLKAARLEPALMERELRAQAEQARQAIAAASGRRQVAWSFRVVRGEVASEVLAAAMGVDLLILGRVSRPLIRSVQLGSTAHAAAVKAPCCVLLVRQGLSVQPPIMVIYDGSPLSRKALAVASLLARKHGGAMDILVVADSSEEEYQRQAETADWARGQGLLIRYRRLPAASIAALRQAELRGVLVLGDNLLGSDELNVLLNEVECPVLLVR